MRKIILSLGFLFITVLSFLWSAQLSITGNHSKFNKIINKDTVTIVIFDSISNSSSISNIGGTTVNWYKYKDTINCSSCNLNYLSPEDSTGYVLEVDGKKSAIWVLSYKNHKPKFISFEPEKNSANQCSELKLLLNGSVPVLGFQTLKGYKDILPREFTVKYQTQNWTDKWTIKDTTEKVSLSNIVVQSPLVNTTFTLTGDQYAKSLGISPDTIKSSPYTAVSVKCKLSSITTLRTETNEDKRPTTATQLEGSAPMDLQFLSNATDAVKHYNWVIKKVNTKDSLVRNDKDQRYSFTEQGRYVVRVKVSDNENFCSDTASVYITVSESAIQVPNVFTPNGDGINDEFRIAYKSIIRFHCWVYNRWGRSVFDWTDPQKGWDGTIGSSKASPGPYFYVIEAYGSDIDANGNPKKYLLKGSINLLRGKE